MQRQDQAPPLPTDEIASLAGRILVRRLVDGQAVSGEKFNTLLQDAQRLAGYVLNADPWPGPNLLSQSPKENTNG